MTTELQDDEFELYDLQIVVESIDGNCTCEMAVGDSVYLKGGKISMADGGDFCLYALQSVLPLLPAKQRPLHRADWMQTDTRARCPDPGCGMTMRIDRLQKRVLKHDDVSPISWKK